MDNYVETLEKQNEELKQSLGKEQAELQLYKKLFEPHWIYSCHPGAGDPDKPLGVVDWFYGGGTFAPYAKLSKLKNDRWTYEFYNTFQGGETSLDGYTLEEAKHKVEVMVKQIFLNTRESFDD